MELERQNDEIHIRRESVERELSEAEPALLSAKESVQNIRKAQVRREEGREGRDSNLKEWVVYKSLDWLVG